MIDVAKIPKKTTKIREVGNSTGLILNRTVLGSVTFAVGELVEITVMDDNTIIISRSKTETKKRPKLNLDINTWDAKIKDAIKKGYKPEKDMFNGMQNEFDKTEW
jgi:antitoxin component of MazEF toxin-antitoxin module